eukprot:SM000035S13096  [mRNA]  locus=s35:359045:359708:- [translate_table: standard]
MARAQPQLSAAAAPRRQDAARRRRARGGRGSSSRASLATSPCTAWRSSPEATTCERPRFQNPPLWHASSYFYSSSPFGSPALASNLTNAAVASSTRGPAVPKIYAAITDRRLRWRTYVEVQLALAVSWGLDGVIHQAHTSTLFELIAVINCGIGKKPVEISRFIFGLAIRSGWHLEGLQIGSQERVNVSAYVPRHSVQRSSRRLPLVEEAPSE